MNARLTVSFRTQSTTVAMRLAVFRLTRIACGEIDERVPAGRSASRLKELICSGG